jgi:hypothetical protein
MVIINLMIFLDVTADAQFWKKALCSSLSQTQSTPSMGFLRYYFCLAKVHKVLLLLM